MYPAVERFNSLTDRLQATFIRLAKDENLWQADLHSALRDIATTLSNVLDVGRVSVWLLNEDRSRLVCRLQFRATEGTFVSGEELLAKDAPGYFKTLDGARLIDASDAINDVRVVELLEDYVYPHGIGAMLNATLHEAGPLAGVLSLEHLGSPRLWSRDEQSFVVSVADLLSQLLVFHALKNSERRYRLLFDAAGDTVLTLRDGVIVDCNPRAAEIFRTDRLQVVGTSIAELSPPWQTDGIRSEDKIRSLTRLAMTTGPQFVNWTFRRLDGSQLECEVSIACMWLGSTPYILAIVRDITERREAELQQLKAAQQLERHNKILQVINTLASRLHRTTSTRVIAEETLKVVQTLQASPLATIHLRDPISGEYRLEAGVGYTEEQLKRRAELSIENSISIHALAQRRILRSNNVSHDPRIDPRLREGLVADGVRAMTVLPLIYQDEPLGSIKLHYYERNEDFSAAELETMQAMCQTVSLALINARNVQELEHQAQHDSLTGLPNRVRIHKEATEALRSIAGTAKGLSLMLLDLDRFKEVNDTLGHRTGDVLLRLMADRLQEALKGHDAMIARLGGDEFAILLRSLSTPSEATDLADSLLATLHRPIKVEGIDLELGGSIGIALYPEHGATSHALLRCADVAMYAAKSQAAGVNVYNNAQDAHSPRRLAMITELGAAIRGNQLLLHFQPRCDLQGGKWTSCEALVRWQHPTLGFIPPSEFVQFAETSDLIRPLTLWVARNALAALKKWRAQGLQIGMAVNLSTRNLLDVTLPDALAALLAEHELPPEALELEITESALMTDPDRALQVVNRMAELGMRLAIDDFGTGYSSLAYLKRLPLHALKIDRSFVKDMLEDEQDSIIVKSTIGLAHSLGLEVVAEGVEDGDTLSRLRTFGCDEIQGFLLGKPMPADAAFALMQAEPHFKAH